MCEANLAQMPEEPVLDQEDLLTRVDLARWSGLPERHPLVGLFHRFGGVRRMNAAFGQLSHLTGEAFVDAVFMCCLSFYVISI